MLLYIVAVPMAFYHSHVALGLVALVTVIWITPTTGVKPRHVEFPSPHADRTS